MAQLTEKDRCEAECREFETKLGIGEQSRRCRLCHSYQITNRFGKRGNQLKKATYICVSDVCTECPGLSNCGWKEGHPEVSKLERLKERYQKTGIFSFF